MSTLALQLDHCLRTLEPAKAAELSAAVLRLVEEAAPPEKESERQKKWRAIVMETTGSLPDFPDDYEEQPWETDRVKFD